MGMSSWRDGSRQRRLAGAGRSNHAHENSQAGLSAQFFGGLVLWNPHQRSHDCHHFCPHWCQADMVAPCIPVSGVAHGVIGNLHWPCVVRAWFHRS